MQNDDDKALVAQAQTDPQAFAALYDRYVDRIYAYAYRQVQDATSAQDVTAVTFEKALRHIRKYRWQGKSFAAWLYRIARNEAMSHHRRQRRLLPWQSVETHANGASSKQDIETHALSEVETAVFRNQRRRQLHHALAKLSAKDRDILSLRFFEALNSEEVAEVLNCSPNNVYVRLHRALKRLQKQLEKMDPQGEAQHVP